jgi:hypothetical protein
MALKRKIAAGIALLLFVVGRAPANIYVRPISFTASENLFIDLDEKEANILGVFEFDIQKRKRLMRESTVRMPLWLPAHAQPDQKNLRMLLETVSFQGKKLIGLNWKSRAVLDEVIGLQVEANGQSLDYQDGLYTYEYDALLSEGYYPKKYWRPGVNEAVFIAKLDNKLIADGKLRIDVQYRQPLIKSEGRTLLFYVPFFDYTGFPGYEKRPHKYKITIKCPEGFSLAARSKHNYHETPTATQMVISPQDQQVILVELIKDGQADITAPLNPVWLLDPKLEEVKGEAACNCSRNKDLNLSAIYKTEKNPMVTINGRNYFLGEKPLGFELMVINPANAVFRCPEGKVVVRELL